MPEQYEKIDREWPLRQAAWIDYLKKGCSLVKATACANLKRFKSSWPA